jgi:hypothetical protein
MSKLTTIQSMRPTTAGCLEKLTEKMGEDVKQKKFMSDTTQKFKGQVQEEEDLSKAKVKEIDCVLNDPAFRDSTDPDIAAYRRIFEAEKVIQLALQGQLQTKLANYAQQALDQTKLLDEVQGRLGGMKGLLKDLCRYGQQ